MSLLKEMELKQKAREIILRALNKAQKLFQQNGYGPDAAESRTMEAANLAEQDFKS